MTKAGERMLEGAREMVAVAKGEEPASRVHINGHAYVPEDRWQPIETAPKDGKPIILELGESIPDVPLIAAGSFLTELRAAELDEQLSASGGWLIYTSDSDWYVIPFDEAFGWMPLPVPPTL